VGVPIHDDRKLFEFLVLEGAQAGLSWITILRKRPAYREAFDGFDPAAVAGYDSRKVRSLLPNEGIVRNRQKIEAAVANARAFLERGRAGAPDPLRRSRSDTPGSGSGRRRRWDRRTRERHDDGPAVGADRLHVAPEGLERLMFFVTLFQAPNAWAMSRRRATPREEQPA
jgi:hypothetical protein